MMAWLSQTFVAETMLMLLVLALRRPIGRFFGAGWAYALWLIPALRLVLPPLALPVQDLPVSAAVLIPTAADVAAPPSAFAGPGQWVPFLLAIWAGGAVIFLILQWLGYRAFLRRLSVTSRPARPPRYGGIATFVSRMVEGPLALGLIEPRIVIPADFSRRYSPGERRLAMEHELTHHRHRDIWWNVAAVLVLALNWFNPLAWLAYRAFRADQELACDAAVAARATIEERCDYARALVKSATGPRHVAACPINGAGTLKRRLRMLRGHRASPARSAGGVAALTLLAVAGVTSATLRSAAAEIQPLIAAMPMTSPRTLAPSRSAAAAPVERPQKLVAIVVRAHRHALHVSKTAPMLQLPPFQPQPAPAQLADASDAPLLAPSPDPTPVRSASAPAPEPAAAMRFAEGEGKVAIPAEWHRAILSRIADPAQRARIEAAIRNALVAARGAETRAPTSLHLTRVVNAVVRTDGHWTAYQLHLVEEGD